MQDSYELMLVFSTKADEKKQAKKLTDIKKYISPDGKITDTVSWGKKTLAYPIKREKEGNFCLLTLTMTGKEAKELTAKLGTDELILRYLLIKKE